MIYGLISGVALLGSGFKGLSATGAQSLFEFATNPLVALMIGTLATALLQSSSTVTSIIVGLVAGGLPISIAIPMVMGANIGTTVTNTIVSLGHAGERNGFRRAFAAATVHDYFNLLAVAIFLPLELATGILERLGNGIATAVAGTVQLDASGFNIVKALTSPFTGAVKQSAAALPGSLEHTVLLVAGLAMIIGSILAITRLLKVLMVGRARELLKASIGRGPLSGIGAGAAVTVLVQSSSTTTSLMVPLAGSGALSLRRIYPFTLGANIGTCVTALLAATTVSGPYAVLAIEIAVIHLLFNALAVLTIYGFKPLRALPLVAALWLSELASRRRALAAVYMLGVFFILPGLAILLVG